MAKKEKHDQETQETPLHTSIDVTINNDAGPEKRARSKRSPSRVERLVVFAGESIPIRSLTNQTFIAIFAVYSPAGICLLYSLSLGSEVGCVDFDLLRTCSKLQKISTQQMYPPFYWKYDEGCGCGPPTSRGSKIRQDKFGYEIGGALGLVGRLMIKNRKFTFEFSNFPKSALLKFFYIKINE